MEFKLHFDNENLKQTKGKMYEQNAHLLGSYQSTTLFTGYIKGQKANGCRPGF